MNGITPSVTMFWIAGASWWTTYRRIVLRLMAPTLMAVAMITFVGAARNIANFALLSTSANRPLSILQLDYVAQRKFEEAVVVADRMPEHHLGSIGALARQTATMWQQLAVQLEQRANGHAPPGPAGGHTRHGG